MKIIPYTCFFLNRDSGNPYRMNGERLAFPCTPCRKAPTKNKKISIKYRTESNSQEGNLPAFEEGRPPIIEKGTNKLRTIIINISGFQILIIFSLLLHLYSDGRLGFLNMNSKSINVIIQRRNFYPAVKLLFLYYTLLFILWARKYFCSHLLN